MGKVLPSQRLSQSSSSRNNWYLGRSNLSEIVRSVSSDDFFNMRPGARGDGRRWSKLLGARHAPATTKEKGLTQRRMSRIGSSRARER